MSNKEVLNGIYIDFPKHLVGFNRKWTGTKPGGIEAEMALLIDLGLEHVKNGGGPFMSAIVHRETEELLCIAGNMVAWAGQSWLHAERAAFALGQKILNQNNSEFFMFPQNEYRLVTTSQMCPACFEEAKNTGISEIAAGASNEDVEKFTSLREGKLPDNWKEQLRLKGIIYHADILRKESCRILQAYGKEGLTYFDAEIPSD